jgi:hypothetical protein
VAVAVSVAVAVAVAVAGLVPGRGSAASRCDREVLPWCDSVVPDRYSAVPWLDIGMA